MTKLNLVLAALIGFLALSSSAAEPQLNHVSTGDLPKESVTTFNPLIELPRSDQQTTVVSELPAMTESTEELTSVAFRDDDEGSDDVEAKPAMWVKFHHHGEHEFGDSNGNDDVRRPDIHRHNHRRFEWEGGDEREDHRDHHHRHGPFDREEREGRGQRFDIDDDEEREGRHGHNHRRFEREGGDEREDHRDRHHRHGRFDRDDDEEREGRGQRFDREDGEEREGRHHHRRHHHDHRHHHHDGEERDDDEGGAVMKMRKFLMGRF